MRPPSRRRVAVTDTVLRVQHFVMVLYNLGMRVVGPLMLCGGIGIILTITYLYYFHVSPLLFPRWSLQWTAMSLPGLWCLINILWNYLLCAFTDPGSPPDVDEEAMTSVRPLRGRGDESDEGGGRHCKTCSKPKPERAHHCRVCKTCVLRMDHHCPWMNNCVGFYNYRYFVLFLLYVWAGCMFTVLVSLKPFLATFRNGIVAHRNIPSGARSATSFALIMCLSIGTAIAMLLAWHLYLTATAQTTIEFFQNAHTHRRRRAFDVNKYDLGMRRNFEAVFGEGAFPLRWLLPSRRPPQGDGVNYPTCRSLGLFDRQSNSTHVL